MNLEAKRNELIQWILSLSEESLSIVTAIKEQAMADETVAYSAKGEPFTKDHYLKHINDIRMSVKNGAKTYTSKDVRDFVLNSRKV